MATDNPRGFGLVDGCGYAFAWFEADSAVARNISVGDAVSLSNTGKVNRALANDGILVAGVVVGTYDADKVPTKNIAASTDGWVEVALATPSAKFTVQDDGVGGAAVTIADVGETANHVDGAGSTFTGRSIQELDRSDIATGGQLRIIGKVEESGNEYNTANVKLVVIFNESICSAETASI